jgi:pyruvate/2-oxoglutarate dehydrogenase complex dihydrolipoamide dehydrogenase (E3) component
MSVYDFLVIGGGSAGLMGAAFAIQLGARTALVESRQLGGDCTWSGCVPSKTLLKAARVAHQMRTAERFGLPAVEPQVDLKAVMGIIHRTIQEVYREETPEALRADGIDVYLESARFVDARTLAVGKQQLTARNFLIATGAHPFIPPIAGLDQVKYHTYETIWELGKLPRRLIVVGGGPIGCEMAQAFQRLGSQVTLLEGSDRLLGREDIQAAQVVTQVFTEEGIDINFNTTVKRVWENEDGIHLDAGDKEIIGDTLLVAVGRKPNVDGLDLEKAGVKFSPKGIEVDVNLRTHRKHIFAAGDCIGSYQFTHYAGWQAVMAARNALLPGNSKGQAEIVPWTTFTDPEVAQVGLTEDQARLSFGDAVMTCDWPMSKVDRARSEGDTTGFLKIVHQKDGTILGVTIVAGRAGEMIHEWIIAINHGLKVGDLSSTMHIYPTYSVASMQASAAIRIDQLLGGTSGKVVRGLARLMN